MSINLKKGQKIDLRKSNPGLSTIRVGLGWDPVEQGGGFLKALFGSGKADIDCDASVFLLDENSNPIDLIYFGNLRTRNDSIIHTGDNLTGEGEGDDEVILVDLDKIPTNVNKLLFVVNIYDCVRRNQNFGMIKNAYIRMLDAKNNSEIARYNLSDDYRGKTALIVGLIYRYDKTWKFSAIGEGTNDTGLNDMKKNLERKAYGV
ncbi:MAG: TerD family protein [Intestinibacter bartlettii]|uniref:TerD family protein n=1 Tax=Intestinibacter bartlettii TaxID=261299 RepID=UPI0026F27529|nr:TerD family protein [Intestinibacter bartlettii]MDO5010893.1 TerD family protein [Intestinibacter bartlettii]